MSTVTFYFYPKLLEIQRLKVGYPYHEILHLSIKIHCHKIELVSYYHNQMVQKGISECLWNLILSNPFFLGCIGKMLWLWVRHHFMRKQIFSRMPLRIIFSGECIYEPLYLKKFLGKNTKFLCSLDWKFPELLPVAHFLRPLGAFKRQSPFFWDTL